MSKVIKNDHLYTDDEVAYLQKRSRLLEIQRNREIFGPGGRREGEKPEEVLELDQDIYDHVLELDEDEVRKELQDNSIRAIGEEHEMKAILAKYLQAQRDSHRKKK